MASCSPCAAPATLFWLFVAPAWLDYTGRPASPSRHGRRRLDRADRRMGRRRAAAGALAVARARGDGDRLDRGHRRLFRRPRVRPAQARARRSARARRGKASTARSRRSPSMRLLLVPLARDAGLSGPLSAIAVVAWLALALRSCWSRSSGDLFESLLKRHAGVEGQRQRCCPATAACSIASTRCSRRCRWRAARGGSCVSAAGRPKCNRSRVQRRRVAPCTAGPPQGATPRGRSASARAWDSMTLRRISSGHRVDRRLDARCGRAPSRSLRGRRRWRRIGSGRSSPSCAGATGRASPRCSIPAPRARSSRRSPGRGCPPRPRRAKPGWSRRRRCRKPTRYWRRSSVRRVSPRRSPRRAPASESCSRTRRRW